MTKEITILGSVGKEGKLKAVFTPEYKDFLDKNKGKNLLMRIEVMPEDITARQWAYFVKVIVPCFQSGYREKGTEIGEEDLKWEILNICPYTEHCMTYADVSKEILSKLIDWSVRFCAEEFCIVVPEPW